MSVRIPRPAALSAAGIMLAHGVLGVCVPPTAAAFDRGITGAAAINAVLAGGAAAFSAPPGGRFRAFRYGLAGGFIASTPLWAADAYGRRGGPYLLKALNAYGADVVDHASAPSNPLVTALRDFAYPIGPGVLSLRDGLPSAYVMDAARLATLAGGFIAGRMDSRETWRLGVPVFRYGHGSLMEADERGEVKHSSYGGLFNAVFIYDVAGVSQDGLTAHEFYHTLQDDRALLYLRRDPRWKRDLFRLGRWLSLRLDGSYVATDAAALGVSAMWDEHDRRPLEQEAELFRDQSGRQNRLTAGGAGTGLGP